MKTTLKFTELEKKVIRNYFSKGINLSCLSDNCISLMELSTNIFINDKEFINTQALKGVIGSLVKKNIFECEDYDDNSVNYIYPSSSFEWSNKSFNYILSLTK